MLSIVVTTKVLEDVIVAVQLASSRVASPAGLVILLYNLCPLRCRCAAWLALQERCPGPDRSRG